jgi:hypothetical protein
MTINIIKSKNLINSAQRDPLVCCLDFVRGEVRRSILLSREGSMA